ncbi:MAG: 5-methyltetrahydropteroyltriglutamate--homocysteine S-methyltransferase [Betaproteobacteria bacterium]|nr:5-methyltetrahydropteroyltriglutamate--homocysteine S-methyltransferase [Betaproteobacteria bacterium]
MCFPLPPGEGQRVRENKPMTDIQNSTALPFHADHIGSLLRPVSLLELRARHAAGATDKQTLTEAENKAIEDALRMQERVGLQVATDGEFRRASYHSYFYRQLGDVAPDAIVERLLSGGGRSAQPMAVIKTRLKWTGPIHVDDFNFIRARSKRIPKITIPGPCALHFRGGDAAVLAHAYSDVNQFWEDTVAAFRSELMALADAGCSYVQIDETAFAKFGDTQVRAVLAARGDDWSTLIDRYIAVTNQIVRGLPKSLRIGLHLCRGNRGGHWHAEGDYEAVAERLFNALEIGFFLLEYDTERAGSFAPLRRVPATKSVVLGLVSSKSPQMETADALKKRIDEAARFVDLERLGLSPQCGFASADIGNPISPQVQEAKLRLVVDVAASVWG